MGTLNALHCIRIRQSGFSSSIADDASFQLHMFQLAGLSHQFFSPRIMKADVDTGITVQLIHSVPLLVSVVQVGLFLVCANYFLPSLKFVAVLFSKLHKISQTLGDK